jgi:membrane-associated phospholipid phosphatase
MRAPLPSPSRPFPRAAFVAVTATLAVVTATLAVSALSGRPVAGGAAIHGALLVGFVVLAAGATRLPAGGWRDVVQGIAIIGIMFFLYGSLGQVAFEAIPWTGDAALRAADRALAGGVEPVLWVAHRVQGSPTAVELLAFFYAAYIPYLYLSIFLGLIGRPPDRREEFITAFAVLYGLSFLGYLFVPAYGPILAMSGEFDRALPGGTFHDLVVRSIDSMGGPHGAFPSLHLGASLMACVFDLRRGDRLRGLVYVPLVALIAVATIALRYHYVVDLLAGAVLATVALAVARRAAEPAS